MMKPLDRRRVPERTRGAQRISVKIGIGFQKRVAPSFRRECSGTMS
jgi:hypothetical protein